jgi:hypothetical protein
VGSRTDCSLVAALDRRFIASLHSQAAIIYRKPNAECALLGEKLSKAKIQLKILCNARSEAFDFLGLSALMLRSNN